MAKFKRNPLAASVMTGVTALLGGIEPAPVAAETHSFSVSVSDTEQDNVTTTTSGSFFDSTNTTAPTSFAKFNDQGGTLKLTQVVVSLITDPIKTQLNVDAKGTCGNDQVGTSGGSCSSSLQNSSEFSALIELDSGISLGADQDFSTALITPGCEFTDTVFSSTCNYSGSNTSKPSVVTFSDTITGSNLALFVGSGSFNVTPALGLGGPFTAFVPSIEGAPFNDYLFNEGIIPEGLSATTDWGGTIEVVYTFQQNGAVPEPATLLLFGTGLAGLGLLRRKARDAA